MKPVSYEESCERDRRRRPSVIRKFMTCLVHGFGTQTEDVCGSPDITGETSWSEGDLDTLLAIELGQPRKQHTE